MWPRQTVRDYGQVRLPFPERTFGHVARIKRVALALFGRRFSLHSILHFTVLRVSAGHLTSNANAFLLEVLRWKFREPQHSCSRAALEKGGSASESYRRSGLINHGRTCFKSTPSNCTSECRFESWDVRTTINPLSKGVHYASAPPSDGPFAQDRRTTRARPTQCPVRPVQRQQYRQPVS